MLTSYENFLANRAGWVSLGDLIEENNLIKRDINEFLQIFSEDKRIIYVSFVQYGVLDGLLRSNSNEDFLLPDPILIEKIPQYLSSDDLIIYSITNNHSISEDYPKKEKRKDLIISIRIINKNLDVQFSSISHINYRNFVGFKILCTCKSNGMYKRDIDLVESWGKFKEDDLISIQGDIVSNICFENGWFLHNQ